MLATLKSSRRELLAAMEGKVPSKLVKRLTLIKDIKRLKELVKDVRDLEPMADKGRADHLVKKYKSSDNNKLANLIQQSAEVRAHLDPESAQRQILTIRYTAYDKRAHYAGVRLAKACDLMGVSFTGPVGLPQRLRRWTVLKSPFKYKKHQESWEQRRIRSIVTIDTGDRGNLVPNLLEFVDKTNYAGVDVKIKIRRFISPEQIYVDPYLKEQISTKAASPGVDYGGTALDSDVVKETLAIPAKPKKTKAVETIIQL